MDTDMRFMTITFFVILGIGLVMIICGLIFGGIAVARRYRSIKNYQKDVENRNKYSFNKNIDNLSKNIEKQLTSKDVRCEYCGGVIDENGKCESCGAKKN